MSNKSIQKKKYYKITFKLESPLAIGSGENTYTDKDIIKDSRGVPYIPATAIAGVTRELITKKISDKNTIEYFFGSKDKNKTKGEDFCNSNLIFYDANISQSNTNHYVSVRDSVALDEYKTAKKGAKFDMEILEPGIEFVTFIEENLEADKNDVADMIGQFFLNNQVSFGGKTMRGYGAISDVSVGYKEFDFSNNSDDIDKWLNFDVYNESNWRPVTKEDSEYDKCISLKLEQVGGISIRRYTTRPAPDKNTAVPDYEQLTVHNGEEAVPTIPGTSWAGAIRHRMQEFLRAEASNDNSVKKSIDKIFGYVDGEGNNAKARSRIMFSETRILGGLDKQISRNAIDRFTGGTVDGALYTESTHYGGTTELKIAYNSDNDGKMDEKEVSALAATLCDLHYGFLAVGGETSIGRGLFHILMINDKEINQEENNVYGIIKKEIEEVLV